MGESKIKRICQEIGLVPNKRKGQNFLINEKILDDVVKTAELKSSEIVLEIGPGFGNLTEELARRVEKVIAVELDKKLVIFLNKKFVDRPNIQVVQGDILKIDIKKLKFKNFSYKLVANLPYNITGAVLRKFLGELPKPSLLVLMLQKEVGERILSKNGRNNLLSLMVNYYGEPKIMRRVSRGNFCPQPEVDSIILRIIIRKRTIINDKKKENQFFQLLKQGFSSPRKQLINNLSRLIDRKKLIVIFAKLKIKPEIRPESLALSDWFNIYQNLYE